MKNTKSVQDRLETKAKKKMDEDFEEFSKLFYGIFKCGIYREHLNVRIEGAVGHGLDKSELIVHLKKVFIEQRTNEYIDREVKDFMMKFNQMSEQFDEMIGFDDEDEE